MLVNLYVLSLVLAAVLLCASLFFSNKKAGADVPTPDLDEAPRPSQIDQLDGVTGGDFLVRTLRSRRFWTFFVSFFGMTGLILDGLELMSAAVSFIVAVGIGAVAGATATAAMRIVSG
ncbi:MAG: hypothetical protein OEV36_02500 [Myxococcales bacterium]|nr:hypothetical protein [Myxococcales bacterium]